VVFSIGLTVIAGLSDLFITVKEKRCGFTIPDFKKNIAFVFAPTLRDIEGLPAKCLERKSGS